MKNASRLISYVRGHGLALLLTVGAAACGDSSGPGPEEPVASLSLEAPAPYMEVGGTLALVATPLSASGSPLTGRPITYTSSATDLATVTEDGEVRGVAPGTVSIRATAESAHATVELAIRESGPLPQTLRDTIRRVDVIIDEGAVHLAEGDLVIVADRTIRVAGELRLPPGAGLMLFSDSLLEVTGSITGASSLEAPAAAPPARNACPGFEEPADVIIAAHEMRLEEADIRSEGAIYVAGVLGKFQGSVRISDAALLAAGRGANGCMGQDADPGYPIEIGTVRAVEKATLGHKRLAAQVDELLILGGSALIAGSGGDGFSVTSNNHAEDQGATLVAIGTHGGRGGDLLLTGNRVHFREAFVRPGHGGNGGSVRDLMVRDGTEERGQNLDARTGFGGDGGDLVVTGTVTVTEDAEIGVGAGGRSGSLESVRGGNGGPTHEGGDFSIHIGAAGGPGRATGIDTSLPRPPRNDSVRVELGQASNGGSSDSPARPGGNGGTLTLHPSRAEGVDLRLINVGNGATGFNGCIPWPRVAGTGGGGGGRLTLNGVDLGGLAARDDLFRGGAGGDGRPIGNGGAPGIESTTNHVFGPIGPQGSACSIDFAVDPATLSVDGIRFSLGCVPQEIGELNFEAPVDLGIQHAWMLIEGGNSPHTTPRTQDAEPEIRLEPASFPLKADEPRSVKVILTCEATESFSGVLTLIGTSEESTASVDVPVSVTIEHEAVLLAATLGGIASGSEVRLARISNGFVGGPEAGCAEPHLHAPPPGILVDGDGPFPDPNPTGCGYGVIVFTEGGR